MLQLRVINRVPGQAAPISYIESPNPTVRDNISLADFSQFRSANSVDFFRRRGLVSAVGNSDQTTPDSAQTNVHLLTDDVVLGNRSVLSSSVLLGQPLFYRHYLGGGPVLKFYATGASVDIRIGGGAILFISAGQTITTNGRSTRELAEDINARGLGVYVQVLTVTTINSTVVGVPLDITVTSSGYVFYQRGYYKVYAPNASTTDMDAARDVIKKSVDILVDGKKSNEVAWDIWAESYDTDGFIVGLYVDNVGLEGRVVQVRFNTIDTDGDVSRSRVEVVNPLPYLDRTLHYELTEETPLWRVSSYDVEDFAWGLGLFSSTSSSVTVDVTDTDVTYGGNSISYLNKSLPNLVAEINESFSGTISASVLQEHSGLLWTDALVSGAYSVKPSGTPVFLNKSVSFLASPSSRIHPLLPYDEESFYPWYPRIRVGKFAEYLPISYTAYGTQFGRHYGGASAELYVYSVPEHSDMSFTSELHNGFSAIGSPWRHRAGERPTVVSEKVLRTQRFPIESQINLVLYDGDQDISSQVDQVCLDQGFLLLSEKLSSYDNIRAHYLYEEKSYIYRHVDLNPIDNPGLIGKFVGIYAIPTQVGQVTWNSTRGLYHIISDDVDYIIDQLATLELSAGIAAQPLLVGIYQVVPSIGPEDVVLRKIQVRGGGIRDDVIPEGDQEFVWDQGRWDGVPFESKGSVIIEVPDSTIRVPSDSHNFIRDPFDSASRFMSHTNLWTEEEVQLALQKWLAAGYLGVVDVEDTDG